MDHYLDQIHTDRGIFNLLFNDQGLYELFFPGKEPQAEYARKAFLWPDLGADLKRYLKGEKVDWSGYPLNISGYRPFTAALLNEVSKIPYGQFCTYRKAAERAGSPLAWRAAGQALAANRHPIIVPCHRVIGSNGKLAGFSGPPGWKEMLLKLEGGWG